MRPNVIADTRAPWYAGLGLREEFNFENRDLPPMFHPVYIPPIHVIGPTPPLHKPTPPPPASKPPVRVIDTHHRIPIPIPPKIVTHPPTPKPPAPQPPPPKPPAPKPIVCATGQAWNGTACIPSGTVCNPPNVLDAAGNCALPSAGPCPTGYVRDASGSCTGDPRNPYSLYLPDTTGGASSQYGGAGTPAAVLPTCASGQFDAAGNCIPPSIWDWFKESTLIPGVENLWVAGGGALAAYFMFFHKSGGRK